MFRLVMFRASRTLRNAAEARRAAAGLTPFAPFSVFHGRRARARGAPV